MKPFLLVTLCVWLSFNLVSSMPTGADEDEGDLDEIIGGSVLPKGLNPYMASVRTYASSSSSGFSLCGGTIINAKNIMTAAHCLTSLTSTGRVEVYVRTWSILPEDSFAIKFTLSRSQVRIHGAYTDSPPYYNDIAVLRLPAPIDFTRTTDPATGQCIWAVDVARASSNFTTYEGADVQASGWGLTSDPALNGDISHNLKMTTLYVLPKADCLSRWSGYDHTRQLCVYAPNTSVCSGDSGGPITYRAVQIGIASFTRAGYCSAQGAVFTRVSFYRYWLSQNMIA